MSVYIDIALFRPGRLEEDIEIHEIVPKNTKKPYTTNHLALSKGHMVLWRTFTLFKPKT
jgi:hypothetical protein